VRMRLIVAFIVVALLAALASQRVIAPHRSLQLSGPRRSGLHGATTETAFSRTTRPFSGERQFPGKFSRVLSPVRGRADMSAAGS
jgi:hypothetical protein